MVAQGRNDNRIRKILKNSKRLWVMVTYDGRPERIQALNRSAKKGSCFREICVFLQPGEPDLSPEERLRYFLKRNRALNTFVADVTLEIIN